MGGCSFKSSPPPHLLKFPIPFLPAGRESVCTVFILFQFYFKICFYRQFTDLLFGRTSGLFKFVFDHRFHFLYFIIWKLKSVLLMFLIVALKCLISFCLLTQIKIKYGADFLKYCLIPSLLFLQLLFWWFYHFSF